MRPTEPTTGRVVADLEVDLDALTRLAARLHALTNEMADRDGSLQGLVDDPDLGPALRHAERDWWDQRRRLHTWLGGAAEAMSGAAKAYTETENAVLKSLTG